LLDVVRTLAELLAETPLPGAGCPPPPDAPNPRWRWLSPTEEEILAVLSSTDWKTGEQIAHLLKRTLTSAFRAVITNLADREIVEASSRGYRFRQGDGESP
jgi:hypothetical protein